MEIRKFYELRFPIGCHIKFITAGINYIMESFEKLALRFQRYKVNTIQPAENQEIIIVSLTSFPARIESIHHTIKTLLNQTVKVNQIILWLAEEQFPDQILPESVMNLQNYGVTVRFCDDLRSHKKYYYAMLENPDAIVITFDDDVIYPENTIEKLLKKHMEYPNSIICNTGRWVTFGVDDNANSYLEWSKVFPPNYNKDSFRIVPIGVGGILYPAHCLFDDVFDKEKIKELAFYADDLWLKCMAVLKGTKSVRADNFNKTLTSVHIKNNRTLMSINVQQSNNDLCYKKLTEKYPQIKKIISHDSYIYMGDRV